MGCIAEVALVAYFALQAVAFLWPPEKRTTPWYGRLRFRLWHLLFASFLVAALLGAGRYGLWPVLWIWLPFSLLAWTLCRVIESPAEQCFDRWWIAAPTLALALSVPARFMLLNLQSWLILAGWCAWGVWSALQFRDFRGWVGQAVPLLLLLVCLGFARDPNGTRSLMKVSGDKLVDVHGGRQGVDVLGVRLGWAGPETATIERYLGSAVPQWRHGQHLHVERRFSLGAYDLMGIVHFESPAVRSLLQGGLGECLEMLPHDEARRQVVAVLTDERNHLRLHQEQVLLRLMRSGYLPYSHSTGWWSAHARIFQAEHDEGRARQKGIGFNEQQALRDAEERAKAKQ